MNKELKKLIKAIEAAGFKTQTAKSGHIKVYDEEGTLLTVFSGTPSDWRSIQNSLRP